MMKRNLLLLLVLFIAGACLDDDTNYDYAKINGYEGWQIQNVISAYTLFPGDSVTMTPKVRLSIDTLNPDVSYSWLLDGKEVSTDSSYTFVAVGDDLKSYYNLIFKAIDNKTGVAFPMEIDLHVTPKYFAGWMFLYKDAAGASQLAMLSGKNQEISYMDGKLQKRRDSLVYVEFNSALVSNLGSDPIRVMEEFTYNGDSQIEKSELMVVQGSGPVELRGSDLGITGRVADEFYGSIPTRLKFKDALVGWTSKWLLSEDNQVYFSTPLVATDLHSGRYSDEPAFNGMKIASIVPVVLFDEYPTDIIPMIDETNTMWVINNDIGTKYRVDGDLIDPLHYVGMKIGLRNNDVGSFDMSYFKNFSGEYLKHLQVVPANANSSSIFFVSLIKKDGKYLWHKYDIDEPYSYRGGTEYAVKSSEVGELNSNMFTAFNDATLVNSRDANYKEYQWLFIASESNLYAISMTDKWDSDKIVDGELLYNAPTNIKRVLVRPFNYVKQNESKMYYAHLGVLLEDGTFKIFEVNYDKKLKQFTQKVIYDQNLKTLIPDMVEVVDVIHKYGDGYNMRGGL